ncbi:hypothetical protein CJD36_009315 [Flavipsychrobacter stenotrophus]|uniref:Uncharacterized protein n=1 Tax=Flavipsychrobacter stenotrophus TaxID=2077091 RepID=A0A2S7SYH7_9BACT|nr:hypothetical protein [Flavipsychrobacter stenotrophus]PQJ11979.1 hypothetical protein CJD36_009315 [Flavipsychrobacter stenotrophus]
MKGIFAFFCFWALSLNGDGQVVEKKIIADSVFISFEWKHCFDSQFVLKDLVLSTDSIHYRLAFEGQIVDVWRNEQGVSGLITNYAYKRSNRRNKEVNPSREFILCKIPLDSLSSRQLLHLMHAGIDIPNDRSIRGWGIDTKGNDYDVADGISYVFEYATPTLYTAKLWSGTAWDTSVREYKNAMAFTDSVYTKLGLQDIYKQFTDTLEPDFWYSTRNVIEFFIVPFNLRKYNRHHRHSKRGK